MESVSNNSQKSFYEFGSFVLDESERLLFRGSEVIPLRPKVFNLLLALVEHSGRILSKDELINMVWSDAAVEEGSLARNISTLRKALGESSGEYRFIETIPWRGYRFVGPVKRSERGYGRLILEEYSAARIVISEDDQSDAKVRSEQQPIGQALNQESRTESGVWWKSRIAILVGCLAVAGLLSAVALTPAGSAWRRAILNRGQAPDTSPQLIKFTTTGNIVFGSMSPDGKFAAYVALETNGEGIWIKQVASGSSLCVVTPVPNLFYWGLTFSSDSNFLYYVVENPAHLNKGVLYRLPVVGGTAEKLLTHIGTHPSFSPDGRQMVFKRPSPNKNELVIADSDGHNQQVWTTSSSIYDFLAYSWSPDGQTIAYANSREDEAGRYWYIAEMPVKGGAERSITKRRYKSIRGLSWLPDGRSLVVVAEDPTTGLFQLWRLSSDDGAERRLTNDVNDYWRVSVTADGSALLTSQQERPGNVFVASMADAHRARQITAGVAGYDTLAWMPENRLVYTDLNNGIYDIWTMEGDGSGQKRLTANAGNNKFPAVSSDGRYILFVSNRAGRFSVWRMEAEGSEPTQIGGETTGRVQCSPDGRQAFYTSDAMGSWALWKVALDGGEPERVRDLFFYRASISPDGKLLAYTYLDEQFGRVRLAVSTIDSNTPIRTFDADIGYEVIRWVDGGNEVAYISGNHEIRIQPIAGEKPRVLVTVPDDLFSFDISRDGKQIAYISGRVTNDLVLIRDF